MAQLAYWRTRPTPERDSFVLGLLESASEHGLDPAAVNKIVIAPTTADGYLSVRDRFGLGAGSAINSNGTVIRNRRSDHPYFAVLLPVSTLKRASDKHNPDKASRYSHMVLHEFAHCHDLSKAAKCPIGRQFQAATAISGDNPKTGTFRLWS